MSNKALYNNRLNDCPLTFALEEIYHIWKVRYGTIKGNRWEISFYNYSFYKAKNKEDILNRWTDLCKYVLKELGNIDIESYQVVTNLQRE